MRYFDGCKTLGERMERFRNPPPLEAGPLSVEDIGGACRWFVNDNLERTKRTSLSPKINADFPLALCAQHAMARITGKPVVIKAGLAMFHDLRIAEWEYVEWGMQDELFDVDGVQDHGGS